MFQRILVKLSGEALQTNINQLLNYGALAYLEKDSRLADVLKLEVADRRMLLKIALDLQNLQENQKEVIVVIGGGNICRGSRDSVQANQRVSLDAIGMLATVMNGLLLKTALQAVGATSTVLSTRAMPSVCDLYTVASAKEALRTRNIIFCVGGIGLPFFSTDTAAVIRARELACDVLFKATKVPGIYDDDPHKNPHAKFIPSLTYDEFLEHKFKIMDETAVSLAKDGALPIHFFSLFEDQALTKASKGALIHSELGPGRD
ncbi:uridylate kinase [Alphaproteobacteria bacterium]|nr:uridylate kinase [Alphaproteobacteria bacterium]GHS99304.1 uridylate kinase [Alphaproteobacteria bacterium]